METTNKNVNQNTQSRYFGEVRLTFILKTHLEKEYIKEYLNGEDLRAKLVLETIDEKLHSVEVQTVDKLNMISFEDL